MKEKWLEQWARNVPVLLKFSGNGAKNLMMTERVARKYIHDSQAASARTVK